MKFINTVGEEKKDPTLEDNPDYSNKNNVPNGGNKSFYGRVKDESFKKLSLCAIAFLAAIFFWACIAHKSLRAVSSHF
jgi:hypothetical protein